MAPRKPTPEEKLQAGADLFKALGHPIRLMMMNLIQMGPRHVEELAAILQLSPATVSHHLAKLADVGLLQARKDQYYQVYSLRGELLSSSLHDLVFVPHPALGARVQEDAYRRKVLRTFLKRGRLVKIPAQRKKRHVILEALVQEFEPERRYPEKEVNRILVEFHDDVAALRRGMIEHGLMRRERGVYQRVTAPPRQA